MEGSEIPNLGLVPNQNKNGVLYLPDLNSFHSVRMRSRRRLGRFLGSNRRMRSRKLISDGLEVLFHSVCFLLSMLCQMTMEIEGCRLLVSSGGYKAVVDCLIKLIEQNKHGVEDNNCIFLACEFHGVLDGCKSLELLIL